MIRVVQPGVSTSVVLDDLRDRLSGTRATVRPADEWLSTLTADTRSDNDQALLLILGPAGVYAVIAILNTMLMDGTRRRREFATGQLIGATPRQLKRVVTGEAALLAGVALAVGFGLVVLVSAVVWNAVSRSTNGMSLVVPWAALGAIGGLAGVLAVGGALVPAIGTLRKADPVHAFQDE